LGQLQVWGLHNDTMELLHQYDLYAKGTYAVSVVDNVIVLHNTKAQVAFASCTRLPDSPARHTGAYHRLHHLHQRLHHRPGVNVVRCPE